MIVLVDRSCTHYRRPGYHVFDHCFPRTLDQPTLRRHDRQLLQDCQHLQGYRNHLPFARSPLVHSCASSLLTLPSSLTIFRAQCWIAVRRENKPLMLAFFVVTALFIASLSSLFGSDAFRFIISSWPFLRALTVASLVGLVISLGLSVWCRMGFGRGLAPQRT